jgi:hypothetical protein
MGVSLARNTNINKVFKGGETGRLYLIIGREDTGHYKGIIIGKTKPNTDTIGTIKTCMFYGNGSGYTPVTTLDQETYQNYLKYRVPENLYDGEEYLDASHLQEHNKG